MRYFTLQEAEALIPDLERLYAAILGIVAQAQAKAARLQAEKGTPAEQALEKGQLEFLSKGISELLQKVLDLGALPKGLDPALVDFPHRLGGREVYLCWKYGEKSITTYHGLQEGYSGRKPLPTARH